MDELWRIKRVSKKQKLNAYKVAELQILAVLKSLAMRMIDKTGVCPACGHNHVQ